MRNLLHIDFSKKIWVWKPEVRYIGFIVNGEGIKVSLDKEKVMRDFCNLQI